MPRANGLKVRGFDADTDRVSIQSTHQDSHLLVRRRWSFLPAKWTELEIERDELIVIKCNRGSTPIELKHVGGPHGDLVVDDNGQRRRVRPETTLRLELREGRAVFVHTASIRHPLRRETGIGVGAV